MKINLNVLKLNKRESLIGGLFATGGVMVGLVAGYKISFAELEGRFAALAEEEINKAHEFYAEKMMVEKSGDFATPEKAAETLGVAPEPVNNPGLGMDDGKVDYTAYSRTPEQQAVIDRALEENATEKVVSVFDQAAPAVWDAHWQSEHRAALAEGQRRYIIHEDEYHENEGEFQDRRIMFFEGDNMLVDEDDTPILDVQGIVGETNLQFGLGSNDSDVVHVRNDDIQVIFEITRHSGNWSDEQMQAEMERSYSGVPVRRFPRDRDD